MIIEIIIIISAIAIFVLVVRRLPDIMKNPEKPVTLSKFFSKNPKQDFWAEKQPEIQNKSNLELGNTYFDKQDFAKAEEHYIKAAAEEPSNPKIYNRLGIIYLEKKNYRDAKDAFYEVLKFDDKVPSRHVNYGLACLNLKNYDLAIKSFEEAIKLDPKNSKYKDMLKDAKNKKKMFEKK